MNDTKFAILFVAGAALGMFMFWFFVKKMIQILKRFLPKTGSNKFVDKSKKNNLTEEFDSIVRKLEFEREQLHAKTRGLFKRAFFRAWFLMGATAVLLAVGLSSEGDDLTAAIIGPLLITALLSLIGAGLYTIVRKEHNRAKFAQLLKQELVSKIVTFVNPELNFLDKGITEEEFNAAEIFNHGILSSEDTIEGIVDGGKVSISECNVRSRSKSSNGRTTIEYKNVKIQSGSRMSSEIESHVLFYGLFLQMELSNITISSPLKIIPARRTLIEDKFGVKITNQSYITDLKELISDDKIDLPLSSDAYNVYCANKEEAMAILTPKFIKVIDFIYSKFKSIEVIMSINKGTFYMAISWNQDMFETDLFLKNNIIESGLANKFHQDIIFINQVITEVGLINKTGT